MFTRRLTLKTIRNVRITNHGRMRLTHMDSYGFESAIGFSYIGCAAIAIGGVIGASMLYQSYINKKCVIIEKDKKLIGLNTLDKEELKSLVKECNNLIDAKETVTLQKIKE